MHLLQSCCIETGQGQLLYLQVGLQARMTEKLAAHLKWFSGGEQACGLRMNHRGGIREPHHTIAAELMGIDASHLRRHVRSNSEQPSCDWVGHLEASAIQVLRASDAKRLCILNERRNDLVVSIATA